MYTIKILTHRIRLDDGHVMPDWEDVPDTDPDYLEQRADWIKEQIRAGKFDTEDYAIRMRRSPKELHLNDVVTKTGRVW